MDYGYNCFVFFLKKDYFMLELKNISLSFKEKKILEDVSFSVNKGEIMLLSGKSGAGKSTILRIIANLRSIVV